MEVLTVASAIGFFLTLVIGWTASKDSRVRLQVLFFPQNMTPLNEPILRDGKTCAQILGEYVVNDRHTIVKIAFASGACWLTYGRLDVVIRETHCTKLNGWRFSREYDVGPEHNEAIERLGEIIAERYIDRIRARSLFSRLGFSPNSRELAARAGSYRWN